MDRERALAFLRDLERADDEVGAVLAELDELAAECERVRLAALELEALFTRLPAERESAMAAVERERAELAAAKETLAEAEKALRRAGGDEDARNAEHFAVRARDRVSAGERRTAEAEQVEASLRAREEDAHRTAESLERRARELAGVLRNRPRLAEDAGADPRSGLSGVARWGSTARAALFVARGQLVAEREAVIRQANELGALVLGEPLSSVGAAAVARRVENELSN